MEINVGDRFVRDTKYGRISYKVIKIEFCGETLEERIHYYGEGPTGTMTDNSICLSNSRQFFTWHVERFNARRIPMEEIGDIKSYVPRHRLT